MRDRADWSWEDRDQSEEREQEVARTLDQALPIAKALDPDDQLRLLLDELVKQLLDHRPRTGQTGASLRGALRDLGPAPSVEDIGARLGYLYLYYRDQTERLTEEADLGGVLLVPARTPSLHGDARAGPPMA